jgi:putative protease
MGFGGFNARRNAKNFTPEEFESAAEYCRMRGVKTYVTLNTLASDREMGEVAEHARLASRLGADAVLVQDLGVMQAVRQAAPGPAVHASTQMSIHNLEGVRLAAAMGASRVVLARELSRREIEHICRNSSIEIEVFVHGALCMCYSGQCYMSAVIGRRSGNRGLCAQPCRLNYSATGHDAQYLLSLKDSCLVRYLDELEKMGVSCIKIEGRMRRPNTRPSSPGYIPGRSRKKSRPPAPICRPCRRPFPARASPTDITGTGRARRCSAFGRRATRATSLFTPQPGKTT